MLCFPLSMHNNIMFYAHQHKSALYMYICKKSRTSGHLSIDILTPGTGLKTSGAPQ